MFYKGKGVWGRRKIYSILVVMLFVCAITATLVYAGTAEFEHYEMTDENDFKVEVTHKKYTGREDNKGAARYSIEAWYMFSEESYKKFDLMNISSYKESTFSKGTEISLKTISETAVDSDGFFTQTKQIDAVKLMEQVKKLYTREQLLAEEGITIYFSPVLRCKQWDMSGKLIQNQLVYGYEDFMKFVKGGQWSGGTQRSVAAMFNTEVHLTFHKAAFTIKFVEVDKNGSILNEDLSGFSYLEAAEQYGSGVLYGEKLSFSKGYTGIKEGYVYQGHAWGNTKNLNQASVPTSIVVTRSNAPGEELVLYFCFQKKQVPLPPTSTPTPTPRPTLLPSGMPSTPSPAGPTATPLPTATPVPTSLPTEDKYQQATYVYYFTTDAGYTMETVAGSTSYYIASENSAKAYSVASAAYTSRNTSYKVGTDSEGNTWYFLPDGEDAAYVHPAVYRGYRCDTSDVKYITELVFPSVITYNGIEYTVRSIGGGTAKYKSEYENSEGGWNDTTGYGYQKDYSYGIITGSYNYYRYTGSGTAYTKSLDSLVSYAYGVLGNGYILSSGSQCTNYSTGALHMQNYGSSYYFYNTTLESITIPDTVTTILPDAFEYCQALNTIHGAKNVETIGSSAFYAAESCDSCISSTWVENSIKNYDYYYYNLSYSTIEGERTDIMLDWELTSKLCSYLRLPEFQNLAAIDSAAFYNHTNLYDVVLPNKVAIIGNNAFGNCKLDSLELMGNPVIKGSEDTLGTNGSASDRTILITNPDSTVMEYGKTYRAYYRIKCGYPVDYEPNGGTGTAFRIVSDLVFRSVNFVTSFAITDDSGNDRCYATDEKGSLWYIDSAAKQKKMEKLPYSVEELVYQDGKYVLLKQGNSQYLKLSYGSSLDAYVFAVQGEIKQFVSVGKSFVVYLTLDNKLYGCYRSGVPVCLSEQPVLGIGSYENKEVYILADGTLWYWGGSAFWQLTSSGYPEIPSRFSIRFVWNNAYGATEKYTRYIDSDGKLWAYQYVSETRNYVWATEEFGSGFCFPSEVVSVTRLYADYRYELTLLECKTGEVYLVKLPQDYRNKASYPPHMEQVITASGGLQQVEYAHLSNSSSTAYNGVLYLLDQEGHLWTAIVEYSMGYSFPEMAAEGRKIKKCEFLIDGSRSSAMMLDEEGYLWSAGYNAYGQTGNKDTYQKPISEISLDVFTKISSQTFADFRMEARISVALGTDGSFYGTGYGYDFGGSKGNYTFFTKLGQYEGIERIGSAKGYLFTKEGGVFIRDLTKYPADNGYDFFATIAGSSGITKAGYSFCGWNTKADGTGTDYVPGEELAINAPLTLYAQWETSKNRIVYKANGGNGYMPDSELEQSIKSFTLPANTFSKKGYKFIGWADSEQGAVLYKDKEMISVSEGTTVLYAKWSPISYTLKFANEAYGLHTGYLSEYHMTYGSSAIVPYEPFTKAYRVTYQLNRKSNMSTVPSMQTVLTDAHTKANFTFTGWKLYRESKEGFYYLAKKYQSGAVVANMTSIQGDVLVMFPEWGGAASYVTLPIASCDGYEFCGWTVSPDETESSKIILVDTAGDTVSVYQPTKNQTLYAFYVPKEYRVELDGQGADVHTQTFVDMQFDQIGQEVVTPKKNRFVFLGYYTKPDGAGDCYFDKDGKGVKKWQIHNSSVTVLYAYWVPDKAIVYDANGGEGSMESTWLEVDKTGAYLSPNRFTKTGYYFDQKKTWNTESDGSGRYYADGQYMDGVTTRVTVYSQWIPIEYQMYYANDSFGKQTSFELEKWKYDTNYVIREQPFVKQNVVSYDLNRGTKSTLPIMTTVLTDAHTKAVYPFIAYNLYEKTGTVYTFLGIQYAEGQSVCNLTAVHGAEFALFPEWEAMPLAVTLPVAECRGYCFEGWSLSNMETDAGNANMGSYVAKQDITLYAVWTPKQYTVTLNGRGATKQLQTSVVQTFDKFGEDVAVPEKTGYTFCGYFTGTRGTGTKYYNADGKCIKTWTETDCKELYAYWVQDEVIFPEEEEKIIPTPLPDEEKRGNLGRTDGTVLLYADDYNTATGALTDMQPYLAYDILADGSIYGITNGADILSKGAIPSTEQICVRGRVGAWSFSYHLNRRSGIEYISVSVTVPYRTQYEDAEEELIISEQKTATYLVTVPKAWSYWEIKESGLYYPKELWLENKALKEGSVCIPIAAGEQETQYPEYMVKVYGGKESHIRWSSYHADGTPKLELVLGEEYIISDVVGEEPEVEEHLRIVCENAAWKDDRNCEARSDFLMLLDEIILDDTYLSGGSGAEVAADMLSMEELQIPLTEYEQLYCSGIPLSETAENGEYKSLAWVVYQGSEKNIEAEEKQSADISKVNSIHIHTPVLCKGILKTEGTEGSVIILREEANFFEFGISNSGLHKRSLGYGMKDFRYALSGKANVAKEDGILLNQVKFPFDVFLDTGNNSCKETETGTELCVDGDLFVEAGNWITIGEASQRFYLPVSQREGVFEIEARTIAVNCPIQVREQDSHSVGGSAWEQGANISEEVYIAYDRISVEIRGFAYGFELLPVETTKEERTAKGKTAKQASVLMLKKGSPIAFRLRTNGSFVDTVADDAHIRITLTYEWISEDKNIRKPVKLYYTEAVDGKLNYYIEVGSERDLQNVHSMENTDARLGISEALIRRTANLLKEKEFYGSSAELLRFSELCLGRSLRMLPERDNVFLPFEVKRLEFGVQEWYGMFYLPPRTYAVLSDLQRNGQPFDLNEYATNAVLMGTEDFFLKDGYIAVNFQIEAVNRFGDVIAYESWEDSGIRAAWEEAGLPYREGDVFCYYLNRSIGEDYEVGGVE